METQVLPENTYQLMGFITSICGAVFLGIQGIAYITKAWVESQEFKNRNLKLNMEQIAKIFQKLEDMKVDITELKLGEIRDKSQDALIMNAIRNLEKHWEALSSQFTEYLMGKSKPD